MTCIIHLPISSQVGYFSSGLYPKSITKNGKNLYLRFSIQSSSIDYIKILHILVQQKKISGNKYTVRCTKNYRMRLSNLFHSVGAAEFNDLLKKGNKQCPISVVFFYKSRQMHWGSVVNERFKNRNI